LYAQTRDVWVAETARKTIERINKMSKGTLISKLAQDTYNPDLGEYKKKVKSALLQLSEEKEETELEEKFDELKEDEWFEFEEEEWDISKILSDD